MKGQRSDPRGVAVAQDAINRAMSLKAHVEPPPGPPFRCPDCGTWFGVEHRCQPVDAWPPTVVPRCTCGPAIPGVTWQPSQTCPQHNTQITYDRVTYGFGELKPTFTVRCICPTVAGGVRAPRLDGVACPVHDVQSTPTAGCSCERGVGHTSGSCPVHDRGQA